MNLEDYGVVRAYELVTSIIDVARLFEGLGTLCHI